MGSRMNLQFYSSNTLRVEGLESLDKETIIFSSKRSTEEDEKEEEEEEDNFWAEGSQLRLGFAESEEAEDMINKTVGLKQSNKVLEVQ